MLRELHAKHLLFLHGSVFCDLLYVQKMRDTKLSQMMYLGPLPTETPCIGAIRMLFYGSRLPVAEMLNLGKETWVCMSCGMCQGQKYTTDRLSQLELGGEPSFQG